MEFPDEIVALIREYSRPLTRRIVRDFWLWENILTLDARLSYVYENVNQHFYESYGPFELIQGDCYFIKSTIRNMHVSFNEKELTCWSGQYEYNGQWLLEQEDIYHKQLLNEKKVVYSKCYLNGKSASFECNYMDFVKNVDGGSLVKFIGKP
jgi:hypothetical protein